MPETGTNLLENKLVKLRERFSDAVTGSETYLGDTTVFVRREHIRDVLSYMKKELGFNVMMDLFANDYLKYIPEKPERFAVIYNLYAMATHERVHVKTWIPESECEIESIHDLYAAANWFEREAWDLYGVVFKNHPNLQRILCHTEFEGHPLRKDYPADKYQRLKVAAPSTGF